MELERTVKMNRPARSVLPATRKRKDRDGSFDNKGRLVISHKPRQQAPLGNTTSANQLLAGYMAHEYLTRGTLFGQNFDPVQLEAAKLDAADFKRKPRRYEPDPVKPTEDVKGSYADVAQLLKTGGAHIPGFVNPTQLLKLLGGSRCCSISSPSPSPSISPNPRPRPNPNSHCQATPGEKKI